MYTGVRPQIKFTSLKQRKYYRSYILIHRLKNIRKLTINQRIHYNIDFIIEISGDSLLGNLPPKFNAFFKNIE